MEIARSRCHLADIQEWVGDLTGAGHLEKMRAGGNKGNASCDGQHRPFAVTIHVGRRLSFAGAGQTIGEAQGEPASLLRCPDSTAVHIRPSGEPIRPDRRF